MESYKNLEFKPRKS